MKKLTLLTISFLIINIGIDKAFAQYSKTKWLNGIWSGIGYQPGALNQNVWTLTLDYNFTTKLLKIDYPSFPCTGNLKLVKANNYQAIFNEEITEGKDRCLDNETVVITKIDENFITISYFLPKVVKGVISFSTLQRVVNQ